MRIIRAQVGNMIIERDNNPYPVARLEFDIISDYGEFHYDSDYRPIDSIKQIMSGLGISTLSLENERLPQADIDISIGFAGDTR